MNDQILIYTDGACKGNPGPGGWGVVIIESDIQKELYGNEKHTTNNIMDEGPAGIGAPTTMESPTPDRPTSPATARGRGRRDQRTQEGPRLWRIRCLARAKYNAH